MHRTAPTPILGPTKNPDSLISGVGLCQIPFLPPMTSPAQVPPVHVSDSCFLEGDQLEAAQDLKRKRVLAVVKRRLGQQSESTGPVRKRRRTKSYVTLMQIDNMLRVNADERLSDYVVPLDENGDIAPEVDLWTIPCLALATVSGPDCVLPLVFFSGSEGSWLSQISEAPIVLFVPA